MGGQETTERNWSRLSGEVLQPSSLRVSKTQLDKALSIPWSGLIADNIFAQDFGLETS